ncbi:Methyltransferase domain protein [Acididesulfobacillus acetoxydans]|uniref:Methyltransferase domain protein n=1 Tax=Acididesulfobacillus acetoxydans TaxID=1561005 RepID=A0A8S0XD67_9FIRM|nr:glycosyltransferase [Acididesulfobacillus acetoxydans]CAA7603186.1 Methyltransferase domain protein [Acididesulfobacillus acetoxydans]CEJ07586.1 Methyltransferase type 11 [Acididesulfobacillus acetoxydans]
MTRLTLPQLNIGVLKSRGVIAPHIMDRFIHALREANQRIFVVDSPKDLADLVNFYPDFALAYGSSGFVPLAESFLFRSAKIPLVSLYFDNPFFLMSESIIREIRNFPEYYYTLIWDSRLLGIAHDLKIPHVFPIALAADPNLFYPSAGSTLVSSLAFVGGITGTAPNLGNSTSSQFLREVLRMKLKQLALPTLSICEELFDRPEYRGIQELYRNEPMRFWHEVYLPLHTAGSSLTRRFVLDSLRRFPLDLYGPGKWSSDNLTFHPPVPYGFELAEVYQKHAINLNISSLQLETSVNNRIFDIPAAGGFLLTDYKDDLTEIFPDHWREITYKNPAELEKRSEYYLSREKERREISADLRDIILTQHTYLHRAKQILETVFSRIEANLPVNRQIREMLRAEASAPESKPEKAKYEGAFNLCLAEIVPPGCHVVLETGCADGLLGQYLLQEGLVGQVFAIELSEKLAAQASQRLSKVFQGDAENLTLPLEPNSIDCLIYGDSLEHMKDPYKLLSYHLTLLKPGGFIVGSIPNIQNLFVIENLLHGNWTYTEWGLLDNTHLRFFTRKELLKWLEKAGLVLEHLERSPRDTQWFKKMHQEADLDQEVLKRYEFLYDKAVKGLDITRDLRDWYKLHDLSSEEALDFVTAQFYFRAKKP